MRLAQIPGVAGNRIKSSPILKRSGAYKEKTNKQTKYANFWKEMI